MNSDEQTARKIMADAQYDGYLNDDVSSAPMHAAIVRALQAAREEGRKSAMPVIHNVEEFYRETTSDGK